MKDSEQAKELEAINSLLEKYIGRSTGFLRKVTNSRYIAVVEERDVRWMLAERFGLVHAVQEQYRDRFVIAKEEQNQQ